MEHAGLLRRLGAILYDSLLVFALLMLATVPFVVARSGGSVEPYTPAHQLTLLIVAYVFFVGFWCWRGNTLGMQAWQLRVENDDQQLPTIGQASIRFVVAIVSWLALGVGFLWQLWDKDKLTWHDRASGTRLRHYPKNGHRG